MVPGAGIVWPQGKKLKKHGRDLLCDDTPNIKTPGLVVSKKGYILRFLYICLCKTCDNQMGPLQPQANNLIKPGRKLVEVY